MKFCFLFFSLVAWGLSANAQTSSEFLFQAGKRQSVLGWGINLNSPNVEVNSGGPVPVQSRRLRVSYEYGVIDSLSVYGNLSYADTVVASINEGIGPLQGGVKYSHQIGSGTFFGRLNIQANALDGKYECNDDSECNVSDSSFGTDLHLAYQWALNNAYTGFLLSYGLFSTDFKAKGEDSIDKKGFLTITAFYERAINDNVWGTSLSYIQDGGLIGRSAIYPYIHEHFILDDDVNMVEVNAWALSGYFRASITESLFFISQLEYSKLLESTDAISSKSHSYSVNLNFRKIL